MSEELSESRLLVVVEASLLLACCPLPLSLLKKHKYTVLVVLVLAVVAGVLAKSLAALLAKAAPQFSLVVHWDRVSSPFVSCLL